MSVLLALFGISTSDNSYVKLIWLNSQQTVPGIRIYFHPKKKNKIIVFIAAYGILDLISHFHHIHNIFTDTIH